MRAGGKTAAVARVLVGLLSAAFAVALGCTWGHEQPVGTGRPVVFPGEALLGASAAIVIDSNYIPTGIGDALEHYDLHSGRVRILIEDTTGTAPATLRSVFPLHAEASSVMAASAPGAWFLIALFDLPQASEMSLATFPSFQKVYIEVDGANLGTKGLIKILGTGGEPTVFDGEPILEPLEQTLEAGTLLRLRAVWTDGSSEGFDPLWEIAGLSLKLRYDSGCLDAPRGFGVGEAVDASVGIGAAVAEGSPWVAAPLVLADVSGFVLLDSQNADETLGGQGPFLDIGFDRVNPESCPDPLEDYVELHDLVVTDADGATLLDLRGPTLGPDSSRYFAIYASDPDRLP